MKYRTFGQYLVQHRRFAIFAAAALFHIAAFVFVRFSLPQAGKIDETEFEVLKLVDVEEYIAPPPVVEARKESKLPDETDVTEVADQPAASELIVQTESRVVEVRDTGSALDEGDFLLQHKVSNIPVIPTAEILSRIVYPPIALKQGIEGVVYLELYIDQTGLIRKINVLKDPGYGFAEAAVAALQGILCDPAMANGAAVAVRFRYPVRFKRK